MDAGDDEDLSLQRSSAILLADIERLLPKLLRRRTHGSRCRNEVRRQVKERDMYRLIPMIESFQEDPQLLDTHLKTFLPALVDAYLESLATSSKSDKRKKGYLPLSHAVCQILNLFCKVRGEKVVKGFLNNEPRYLEPILNEFEKGDNFVLEEGESLPGSISPWTERYVLLLWLSHLMLAPFPLASMSAVRSSAESSSLLGIDLPSDAPEIALRCLTICVKGLKSATKERGAAANLLVRLCIRPDMQKLGLLDAVVNWSLTFFGDSQNDISDIHQYLGLLSFLAGLVTSATNEEVGAFLPAIHETCQRILQQENLQFVRSSAVARKSIIKTLRNIVVHCLRNESSSNGLDTTTVVEEAIEFLLEAVADGDTPVRYAASKALSVITMKLDSEMAVEVVEAILGSLGENVYWQGSHRNLSGVNPLQWHGLTLTLSQLLYRRAVSTTQLPDILNALLLALAFEQRSATGGSIGTNVRDAACFGIWALARRYTTAELLAVETTSVRASEHLEFVSILQVLATELLVVACLDPAGNIRRGSSAALQELIGRHPDTVKEGIPLVQIVDFHTVGLRERAMCDVAVKAGKLGEIYWKALFESLLGWRGTGSLDTASRLYAASAVGLLYAPEHTSALKMATEISDHLKALRPREIEERHGLVMSLSTLLNHAIASEDLRTGLRSQLSPLDLISLSKLFGGILALEDKFFTSPALRPELTASSMCTLLGTISVVARKLFLGAETTFTPTSEIVRLLNLCLTRHEDSVLDAIASTVRAVHELLLLTSPEDNEILVGEWLTKLENEASYNGLRCSGYAIALGAVYPPLKNHATGGVVFMTPASQARIVETLTFRCTAAVAIEPRTVALRALNVLLATYTDRAISTTPLPREVSNQISSALRVALNDYTVTERGDVGSLVRLEALTTIGTAWSAGLMKDLAPSEQLYADVLRLSLEKLDKIRARSAHVLEQGALGHLEVANKVADRVSSYAYFANALKLLQLSTTDTIREAICVGLSSSAGMGSESVVQNSRAALLDAIDLLPVSRTDDTDTLSLLDLANCYVNLLKRSLEMDRTLLPLLEVIAFLFDAQVMQRLIPTTFNYRLLLSLTQKAHFKSTHIQKLHLALDIYRGLASIPATRQDTITKLASMLLHPFPNIRIAAAETLWILTEEDGLKRQDWSLPSKSLKPIVGNIKSSLSA